MPTPPITNVPCVIPAAGLSSRMPGHKLTTPFRDKPLVVHALLNALAACSHVVVVLGHASEAVRRALETTNPNPHTARRISLVHNPIYHRGMLSSIHRGLREIEDEWCFIAPADMPFLKPALYEAELNAAHTTLGHAVPGREPAAFLPRYEDQPAHPVLVNTTVLEPLGRFINSVPAAEPLPSMGSFLTRFQTQAIAVDEPGSTIDLDTAEAFERFSAQDPSCHGSA